MATSVTTGATTLDESAVQGLAAAMRGPLIQRGDPTYDEARTVYNAMIDKHPALIAPAIRGAAVTWQLRLVVPADTLARLLAAFRAGRRVSGVVPATSAAAAQYVTFAEITDPQDGLRLGNVGRGSVISTMWGVAAERRMVKRQTSSAVRTERLRTQCRNDWVATS